MPTHSLESIFEATLTLYEIILRLLEFLTEYLTEYLRQNTHGRMMYSPQTC